MARLSLPRLVALLLASVWTASTVAQPASEETVRVEVGGKVHSDFRVFPEAGATGTFLLRRARVEVLLARGPFRALVEPDFGEGGAELVDGWVEADLAGGLRVRAGRFKTPFGYESLRSSSDLRFAERGLPTALSPRRDLGAMLSWSGGRTRVAAGVFNGVKDGGSESGEAGRAKDVAARVFSHPLGGPLAGLGLGLAVAAGSEHGEPGRPALATYETAGDRAFFQYRAGVHADGRRVRIGPQGTLDVGPLSVLGELTWAGHGVRSPEGRAVDLTHRAWQAAVSVVLVGASRGDKRPVPIRSVREGGPGAVEVSARLQGVRLDPAAAPLAAPDADAQRASAWAVAVHWSPTAEARLGATVERTAFEGFEAGAGPEAETLLVLRAQLDF